MTAKDPNSHSGHGSRKFTLPKHRILRGKKNFQQLFESGSVLHGSAVQFRYLLTGKENGVKIGFIAKKSLGNAVTRNRTKRLLREAWRLQQEEMINLADRSDTGIHGVFMAKRTDLTFQIVQNETRELIEKLQGRMGRQKQKHNRQ